MSEKFTPEKLFAGEAYCDNGALSHWEFVNDDGERIGIFCDEDALTIDRMKRQEAYAHLFAAAPEMYEFVKMFTSTAGQFLLSHADNGKEIYNEAVRILKKARGEE